MSIEPPARSRGAPQLNCGITYTRRRVFRMLPVIAEVFPVGVVDGRDGLERGKHPVAGVRQNSDLPDLWNVLRILREQVIDLSRGARGSVGVPDVLSGPEQGERDYIEAFRACCASDCVSSCVSEPALEKAYDLSCRGR